MIDGILPLITEDTVEIILKTKGLMIEVLDN